MAEIRICRPAKVLYRSHALADPARRELQNILTSQKAFPLGTPFLCDHQMGHGILASDDSGIENHTALRMIPEPIF